MTFADGSCEVRSRSEEEAMQGHRRRRATQRSPATPISPKGGGGTASISLSLLLHDARTSRRRRFANSTPSRLPQMSWYSWDETLPRIMHKFSTAATKSSGVRCAPPVRPARRVPPTRKRAVQHAGLLNVLYSTFAGADPKRVPSRVAQRTQVVAFVAS